MPRLEAGPSARLPYDGEYSCTQAFGNTQWEHPHTGIDIGIPSGTPILSPVEGTVTEVYDHDVPNYPNGGAPAGDGCGNYLVIKSPHGDVFKLCHLHHGFVVKAGQDVYGGQHVAYSGNSGWSTGPHLHIEYHPHGGAAADPLPLFPGTGPCPR